ncbi:MAG: filamentous hemagglutinin N-terminal domain-containing protein [Burkholderiales bacterium]|jgi:filamentous hemagglutinin family protein|nr:filamentous hemagglutinin N-terminal domain-containing protein [Burkholderiales bacterium]
MKKLCPSYIVYFFLLLSTYTEYAFCQAPGSLIVPDGKTPTQVHIQETGRSAINIAPPVRDGVSYNSYSQFSVDRFGVDFNNHETAARLIINEINGHLPSVIEGDIAVLGRRANFILANENGIKIDGGTFTNMGSIALTTGRVELYDFNPAPDVSRRDALLRTNRGLIEIGGNGLTGAFNRLDLISKSIKINGPALNTYDNAHATIRIIAGDSLAQINSNISPADDASDWLAFRGEKTSNQNLIVDITPLGSLSSGRIEIAVTDKGAGMRHAGEILARAGDFVLSSDGEVVFEGSQNSVAQTTLIRAERVTMASGDSDNPTTIVSGKDVQILAPEFHLSGVKITAGNENEEGHVIIGASDKPSQLSSSIGGIANSEGGFSLSQIQAAGSVLIGSDAQALRITGANIEANASIGLRGTKIDVVAASKEIAFLQLMPRVASFPLRLLMRSPLREQSSKEEPLSISLLRNC